jgi:hypothetical protein
MNFPMGRLPFETALSAYILHPTGGTGRHLIADSSRTRVWAMRKLHYSSDSILVGDRTCKAVLRYSRALAIAGKADVVTVPTLSEGGTTVLAHLLIGPASQIYSTPVEQSGDDPDDRSIIERLEALTMQLEPSRPAWPQEMEDIPDLDNPWRDEEL